MVTVHVLQRFKYVTYVFFYVQFAYLLCNNCASTSWKGIRA